MKKYCYFRKKNSTRYMRKALFFLAAVCLSLTCWSQARDSFEEIRQDPWKAGTVHYMYNHDIPACAKAPAGYKSFYISHYGRHGARNHSSDSDFDNLYKLLPPPMKEAC